MKKPFTFHWGWRIAVVYSIFVIGTLTMVAIAFNTEVNLVREDYYQHSLQHNMHSAGAHHTQNLPPGSCVATAEDDGIRIHIPFTSAQVSNGKVQLFRPSTATTDVFYDLKIDDNGFMTVSKKGLASGLWRVKCAFTANEVYYEFESAIVLP
ncbi:MAG: FixH family protein [Ignavibacteria bacterium]|nr:FixH family protein [Ignavibacteria bacterium]